MVLKANKTTTKSKVPLSRKSNQGSFASMSASYATRQHCPQLLKERLVYAFKGCSEFGIIWHLQRYDFNGEKKYTRMTREHRRTFVHHSREVKHHVYGKRQTAEMTT